MFRDITDLFYDKIIPYVFWARGDFHLAANLFTKLIEGEKRSRCRAMYMVEIARMHAQLGEPETASRFYRMAADIALEKGKALKHEKEVSGQMLMLMASIYDQGMMTSKSDQTAAEHWRYVVTSGTFNRGAANMAAISMLCFHSRPSCDTEPSSFVEARRRLEALAEKCPKFLYYISLLQALAGEESDAENFFKTYKQREQADGNTDGPGLSMNISSSAGTRRKRPSFWQSLSTMVSKSGHPQPLYVLWRSHLQPLRVCDPTSHFPPTEADLCCDNLDLRLNSQGYLTGNMKLMLPPIRSVNLNPYTGKLCFPRTPGSTEVWTTMDRFLISSDIDEEDHDTGLIPCPLEVYRDEDGTTVQMMLPATLEKYANSYSQTNTHAAALTFFWCDDKGQTARLSVLATFWRLIYEKLGLRFKREALRGKKSEQWLEDCLKVLKFCLDTKRELDYEWITRVVDYDIVEARKKNSKLSIVKFLTSLNDTCLPELLWSRNYTCYGKTLVLGFDFSRWNITVFLDCSSRDSFLQPDIRLEAGNTHIPDIPNSKNHKLAGAEIYYLRYTKSKENTQHFKVCGEKGNVLETIDMEDDGSDDHLPYVIGSSLLIITFRSRLWCWNDYKIKVDEALPPLQKITPTDCSVVMVTLRDSAVFRFVNTPSLESVPIRTNCNLMEPFKITEDGLEFKAASSDFKVLSTCSKTENNHSFQEVILGMDTNLVTIHILEKDEKGLAEVIITDILPLPGTPVEHCFIGKNDGFLVTWTQQYDSNKDYEENLFYFNKESELLGVLPCLGKGPRSFSPLYLPGDPDTQTDFPGYGLPGWYVYMRDGHDGIIGVKLPIQHRTS
ncbi:uncharacterized protein [Argopecten irradians]|uniref:uncharacterized protein isoform X2 n=1 Tax=Argopecten irradians TaxID=31199 RepID=UPI003710CF51